MDTHTHIDTHTHMHAHTHAHTHTHTRTHTHTLNALQVLTLDVGLAVCSSDTCDARA